MVLDLHKKVLRVLKTGIGGCARRVNDFFFFKVAEISAASRLAISRTRSTCRHSRTSRFIAANEAESWNPKNAPPLKRSRSGDGSSGDDRMFAVVAAQCEVWSCTNNNTDSDRSLTKHRV